MINKDNINKFFNKESSIKYWLRTVSYVKLIVQQKEPQKIENCHIFNIFNRYYNDIMLEKK